MRLKNSGLFTGIEREGMLAGTPTLFVQGTSVEWEEILETARERNLRHVEFGAGRYLWIPSAQIQRALDSNQFDQVTVETSSIELMTREMLDHPKLYMLVTLIMPEAVGPDVGSVANPTLIEEYARNPRIQIKVATGVQIAVMNCNGLTSFNRNDIFVADVALNDAQEFTIS